MKFNAYYKTLKGDIGKAVGLAYLNNYLEDTFSMKEDISICLLEFDDGSEEWWLSTQLIEVDDPQATLF